MSGKSKDYDAQKVSALGLWTPDSNIRSPQADYPRSLKERNESPPKVSSSEKKRRHRQTMRKFAPAWGSNNKTVELSKKKKRERKQQQVKQKESKVRLMPRQTRARRQTQLPNDWNRQLRSLKGDPPYLYKKQQRIRTEEEEKQYRDRYAGAPDWFTGKSTRQNSNIKLNMRDVDDNDDNITYGQSYATRKKKKENIRLSPSSLSSPPSSPPAASSKYQLADQSNEFQKSKEEIIDLHKELRSLDAKLQQMKMKNAINRSPESSSKGRPSNQEKRNKREYIQHFQITTEQYNDTSGVIRSTPQQQPDISSNMSSSISRGISRGVSHRGDQISSNIDSKKVHHMIIPTEDIDQVLERARQYQDSVSTYKRSRSPPEKEVWAQETSTTYGELSDSGFNNSENKISSSSNYNNNMDTIQDRTQDEEDDYGTTKRTTTTTTVHVETSVEKSPPSSKAPAVDVFNQLSPAQRMLMLKTLNPSNSPPTTKPSSSLSSEQKIPTNSMTSTTSTNTDSLQNTQNGTTTIIHTIESEETTLAATDFSDSFQFNTATNVIVTYETLLEDYRTRLTHSTTNIETATKIARQEVAGELDDARLEIRSLQRMVQALEEECSELVDDKNSLMSYLRDLRLRVLNLETSKEKEFNYPECYMPSLAVYNQLDQHEHSEQLTKWEEENRPHTKVPAILQGYSQIHSPNKTDIINNNTKMTKASVAKEFEMLLNVETKTNQALRSELRVKQRLISQTDIELERKVLKERAKIAKLSMESNDKINTLKDTLATRDQMILEQSEYILKLENKLKQMNKKPQK
jgi:hypothetical protein